MATVFTNVGMDIVTDRIKGLAVAEPKFVAWGTGAGTAVVADTTLFTEASEARTSGTSTQETTTQTNDTYQVIGTITADGTKTITNSGLLTASSAGSLLMKGDFTGVALVINESIQFTWKLQIA